MLKSRTRPHRLPATKHCENHVDTQLATYGNTLKYADSGVRVYSFAQYRFHLGQVTQGFQRFGLVTAEYLRGSRLLFLKLGGAHLAGETGHFCRS